jgi:hypothetical protein
LKWCSPYCQTPSKQALCNLYVLSAMRIIGEISAVSFRCFGCNGGRKWKFPSCQDGRLGSLIGRAVVFEQGRRSPRRTAGSARIIWVGTAWASAVGISVGGLLLSSRLPPLLAGLAYRRPFSVSLPVLTPLRLAGGRCVRFWGLSSRQCERHRKVDNPDYRGGCAT